MYVYLGGSWGSAGVRLNITVVPIAGNIHEAQLDQQGPTQAGDVGWGVSEIDAKTKGKTTCLSNRSLASSR